MTVDRMNLTGAWFGSFSYLGTTQADVSFIATIEEVAGLVTGETSEHTDVAGLQVELKAILRGSREGADVSFIKAYDGAGMAAHAVEYRGTLSDDGKRVSGAWEMEGVMGGFEMHREIVDVAAEEVLEAEAPLEFEGLLER
ncbi:hypothetical protein [Sphingomonas jatrophae]|uniref:Uncharacterized protein n=1 Tax=Sphingomonas jatrophae TaxID=1166337 RepID=A0A1I6JM61_9SPHN|nr:hypothetical protein [Sphingomonas jatrophae]SFR80044.1 hypothetical protein SAMN05192580_0515 [Sphingomonas jatrophae]